MIWFEMKKALSIWNVHKNEVFGMRANFVRGYARKQSFLCVPKNLKDFLCNLKDFRAR